MKFIFTTFFLIIFFSTKVVYSASFTFPSTLTTNTSDFVLLSETGTTPSVSGFSTDVLITITATAGFVKITTVTGLEQINGFCGYTADNSSSEPANCSNDNRTEIGFEGTQAEVNNALATLSFKGDGSTSSATISVSATPTGASYNPVNGHYYRAIAATDIEWDDARATAKSDAQKFNGLRGYLVNITSAQENAWIKDKISTNAWTGGSDSGTERIWKWMDGPEAGQSYTCAIQPLLNSGGPGATISGCSEQSYLNWLVAAGGDREPNDYNRQNEDYMHVYGALDDDRRGKWNDFVIDNDAVDAYIIEYGGQGGTATAFGAASISITSTEATDNPFNVFDDKELVGIVEGQSESAKRFIYGSTYPVLERMEWYRTTKKNDNIKFQDLGIDIDTTNKDTYPYAKLLDAYLLKGKLLDVYLLKGDVNKEHKLSNKNIEKFISELPLSQYLKNEFGMVPRKWKIWSSGYFKKGKVKVKSGKVNQEFDSDALTIGIDKIIEKNTLFGIAIRLEDQDTDVGQLGTKINSDAKSATIYSSWHNNKSTFIDGLVGYGYIENDLTRIEQANTSNSLTGNRGVKQYFSSIKFNKIMDKDNFTSLLFGRADYGLSKLESFSEIGNIQALKFEEQNLKNKSISIGALTKYKKKIKKGYFLPYGRIEFFENLTPNSKVKASYISDPNTEYSYTVKEDYSNSIKLELGFDLNLIDNWYLSTSIRRLIKNNKDFENEFAIKAGISF